MKQIDQFHTHLSINYNRDRISIHTQLEGHSATNLCDTIDPAMHGKFASEAAGAAAASTLMRRCAQCTHKL